MNINGQGAKPIYINGTASSTSNYTLPAGSYFVYYNGTNYYFRTDGLLTAGITGNAGTATKLSTARDLHVALGTTYDSSAPVTFDGSAAKTLPVSGTLPIARGGTGNTGTGATTTLSSIGTAGSNVTVSCSYSYWGKVASFFISVKANAAISANATLFTFATGKRPKYQQYPQGSTSAIWTLTTGGILKCASALTSGTTYYCSCTYLIA